MKEAVFILDMKRMIEDKSPVLDWIDNLEVREIGVAQEKKGFNNKSITEEFDYLIYIRNSTPSHFLY